MEGGSEMNIPLHVGKIQIEVTLSEETLKELFAAIALQKLMPQQQVADYVTSARELAAAMMKARKEDSK
jgi:predicted nucleic acid-binding protein